MPPGIETLEGHQASYLTILTAPDLSVLQQHHALARQYELDSLSEFGEEVPGWTGPPSRAKHKARQVFGREKKEAAEELRPELEDAALELGRMMMECDIAEAMKNDVGEGERVYKEKKQEKWAGVDSAGCISGHEADFFDFFHTLGGLNASENSEFEPTSHVAKSVREAAGTPFDADEPIIHPLHKDPDPSDDKLFTKRGRLTATLHPAFRNDATLNAMLNQDIEKLAHRKEIAGYIAIPDDVRAKKTAVYKRAYDEKLKRNAREEAKRKVKHEAQERRRDAYIAALPLSIDWEFPSDVRGATRVYTELHKAATIIEDGAPNPNKIMLSSLLALKDERAPWWMYPIEWTTRMNIALCAMEDDYALAQEEARTEAEKERARTEKLVRGSEYEKMLLEECVVPTSKDIAPAHVKTDAISVTTIETNEVAHQEPVCAPTKKAGTFGDEPALFALVTSAEPSIGTIHGVTETSQPASDSESPGIRLPDSPSSSEITPVIDCMPDSADATSVMLPASRGVYAKLTSAITVQNMLLGVEPSGAASESFDNNASMLLNQEFDLAVVAEAGQEEAEEEKWFRYISTEAYIDFCFRPPTLEDEDTWAKKLHISILNPKNKRLLNPTLLSDKRILSAIRQTDEDQEVTNREQSDVDIKLTTLAEEVDWIRIADEYRLGLNGRGQVTQRMKEKNRALVLTQQPDPRIYVPKDLRFEGRGYFSDILPKPFVFPEVTEQMIGRCDAAWMKHCLAQRIGLLHEDQLQKQTMNTIQGQLLARDKWIKPTKGFPRTVAQGRPPPKSFTAEHDTQAALVMAIYQTLYEERIKVFPKPSYVRGQQRIISDAPVARMQKQNVWKVKKKEPDTGMPVSLISQASPAFMDQSFHETRQPCNDITQEIEQHEKSEQVVASKQVGKDEQNKQETDSVIQINRDEMPVSQDAEQDGPQEHQGEVDLSQISGYERQRFSNYVASVRTEAFPNLDLAHVTDDNSKRLSTSAVSALIEAVPDFVDEALSDEPKRNTFQRASMSENKRLSGLTSKRAGQGFGNRQGVSSLSGRLSSAAASIETSDSSSSPTIPFPNFGAEEKEEEEAQDGGQREELALSMHDLINPKLIVDQFVFDKTPRIDVAVESDSSSNDFSRKLKDRRAKTTAQIEQRIANSSQVSDTSEADLDAVPHLASMEVEGLSIDAGDEAASSASTSSSSGYSTYSGFSALMKSCPHNFEDSPAATMAMTPAQALALVGWLAHEYPDMDVVAIVGKRFLAYAGKGTDAEPVELSDEEAESFFEQLIDEKTGRAEGARTMMEDADHQWEDLFKLPAALPTNSLSEMISGSPSDSRSGSRSKSLSQDTKISRCKDGGGQEVVSKFLMPSQVRAFVAYLEKNGHPFDETREVTAYMALPEDVPPRKFNFTRPELELYNRTLIEQKISYEKRREAYEKGEFGYAFSLSESTDPHLIRDGSPISSKSSSRSRSDSSLENQEKVTGIDAVVDKTEETSEYPKDRPDCFGDWENIRYEVDGSGIVLPKRHRRFVSRELSTEQYIQETEGRESPPGESSEGAFGLGLSLPDEGRQSTATPFERSHPRPISAGGPGRDRRKTAAKISTERQKHAETPTASFASSFVTAKPSALLAGHDATLNKDSDDSSDGSTIGEHSVSRPLWHVQTNDKVHKVEGNEQRRSDSFSRTAMEGRRESSRSPSVSSQWSTILSAITSPLEKAASTLMPATDEVIPIVEPLNLGERIAAVESEELSEEQLAELAQFLRNERLERILAAIDDAVERAHAQSLRKARRAKREQARQQTKADAEDETQAQLAHSVHDSEQAGDRAKLDAENEDPSTTKPADLLHDHLHALDPKARFKDAIMVAVAVEHLDLDEIEYLFGLIAERDAEAEEGEARMAQFYHEQEHQERMQLMAEHAEYEGAMASIEAWRESHVVFVDPDYFKTESVPSPKEPGVDDGSPDGALSDDSDDTRIDYRRVSAIRWPDFGESRDNELEELPGGAETAKAGSAKIAPRNEETAADHIPFERRKSIKALKRAVSIRRSVESAAKVFEAPFINRDSFSGDTGAGGVSAVSESAEASGNQLGKKRSFSMVTRAISMRRSVQPVPKPLETTSFDLDLLSGDRGPKGASLVHSTDIAGKALGNRKPKKLQKRHTTVPRSAAASASRPRSSLGRRSVSGGVEAIGPFDAIEQVPEGQFSAGTATAKSQASAAPLDGPAKSMSKKIWKLSLGRKSRDQ